MSSSTYRVDGENPQHTSPDRDYEKYKLGSKDGVTDDDVGIGDSATTSTFLYTSEKMKQIYKTLKQLESDE